MLPLPHGYPASAMYMLRCCGLALNTRCRVTLRAPFAQEQRDALYRILQETDCSEPAR